jgi:hypothetical protein
VYEAIDEPYLGFLNGLKVEIVNNVLEDCFFEVNSISELDDGNSFLVLLSKRNLFDCNCIFQGNLTYDKNKYLFFKLGNLKHKIRIYHTNAKLSFRYFIDYFYDIGEMNSNYVLIKKEQHYIDIVVSNSLQ